MWYHMPESVRKRTDGPFLVCGNPLDGREGGRPPVRTGDRMLAPRLAYPAGWKRSISDQVRPGWL